MIFRIIAFFILIQLCGQLHGQVVDDFTDGDFTSNPVWLGNSSSFQVLSGVLNTNNDPDNGGINQYYLSTPSSITLGASWEFFIDLQFATSGANYVDVYLMSDSQDLTSSSINGYFVRCGNTDDEIVLYKTTNGTKEVLIDFGDDLFDSSTSNPFKIRVTRDVNNFWTLSYDDGNTGSFIVGGTATDGSFSSSAHFGFLIIQSSLNGAVNGHFFDDIEVTDPIELVDIRAVRDTLVRVTFDQEPLISTIQASNFIINDKRGNLLTKDVRIDTENANRVFVSTAPILPDEYVYKLQNIADAETEQVVPDIEGAFNLVSNLTTPQITTISNTELLLDFDVLLNETSVINGADYVVSGGIGGPSTIVLDPSDHSIIRLTFDTPFLEGVNYQVDISGVLNRDESALFSGSANFEYIIPLIISNVLVQSETSLLVSFNKELQSISAETLTNYMVDGDIGMPASSLLSADNQSVTLIFSSVFVDSDYTLSISNLIDTGGNTISNVGNSISFSYLPLAIIEIAQVDTESISVGFNQKVESISAELHANYQVLGSNPSNAVLQPSDSVVILTFPDLVNNNYTLTLSTIENQINNSSLSTTQVFDFEKPTPFRDIIVTEIMADPTPSVGQPVAEYIELFNRSDQAIRIASFELNGATLPDYTIDSEAYLLVASTANYNNFFISLPNAIGQAGFDALSNAGDIVVLHDQFGNQVDSLFYDLDWYDDEIKEDGGYSLELINPNQICSEDNNWTASVDASGGTPGEQNSVYSLAPDVGSPEVSLVEVIDPQTIEIRFNEPMDLATISQASLAILDYTIVNVVSANTTSFRISINTALLSEAFYTIEFTGVTDCSGNLLSTNSFEFYYDISPPVFSDLVILSATELALRFNEPLRESIAETEANFSIMGINPERAILQDSATNRVHLTFEDSLIVMTTYILEWRNLRDTVGNVISLQQFPFTYQNQLDSAYVIAPNLLAIKYQEIPSPTTASIPGKYKNEDGVSPLQVSIDEVDSTLIFLSFRENFDENRSLLMYVEGTTNKLTREPLITPAIGFVFDTRPPVVSAVQTPSSKALLVVWNEPIDVAIAFSSRRYSLETGARPTNVSIVSSRSVALAFANSFPVEVPQSLSISGIPDIYGNVFATARKTTFTYDTLPPILTEVIRTGLQMVRLTFHEQLFADSVSRLDNFELSGVSPTSAQIEGPDSVSVILTFDEIADMEANSFSIKNISDQKNNTAPDTTLNLNTVVPYLVSISALSSSLLSVAYSKPMSESAGVLENYRNDEYDLASVVQSDPKTFLIDINGSLVDGDEVSLDLRNISDSEGNLLAQLSADFTFQTFYNSSRFVDDQTIELMFDTEFEAIGAGQFSLAGIRPQIAVLDGEEKNTIRLFFAQEISPNVALRLNTENLTDIYGRRLPDLETEVFNDGLPPDLLAIESDFFGVLNVTFNETLEEESAISSNVYTINGLGNPSAVKFDGAERVVLDFDDRLVIGESYQLQVKNLSDVSGNFLQIGTYDFVYNPPLIPKPGDIIITEYMADPSPIVGLPEVEYIELFNKSDQPFNLKSLRMTNQNDIIEIGDYVIAPEEYVLLLADEDAFLFENTNKLGMAKFPDLLNTTGGVGLVSITGEIIDLAIYNISWYGDTDKDDGGYSLELINTESSCVGKANWTASRSESGGTPGFQNSVNSRDPDMELPTIVAYDLVSFGGSENLVSFDSLILHFSEPMDSLSILKEAFQIEDLSILSIETLPPYFEEVRILLSDNLTSGIIYELNVSGLSDCSGNVMAETVINFGVGRKPSFNELLITEIMADPDPVVRDLPNAEYLEIFNATDDLLSLEDILLTDGNDSTFLPSQIIRPQAYLILSPTSVADEFSLLGNAMGVPNWPSLANGGEQISLWVGEDLIFEIDYQQAWHAADQSSGGYSLEMKDLTNPCGGRLVWGSSSSADGGTPGKSNANTASIPDNFGPNLLSAFVVGDGKVELTFDEKLDFDPQVSIVTDPILSIQTISQLPLNRHQLTVTFSQEIQSNLLYSIQVSDVIDCNGNEIMGDKGTFVRPLESENLDVIINEILFDPKTGGVDFVEIYNNSQKYIDLKDWSLAREIDGTNDQVRPISTSELIIGPEGYLALSADAAELILQYPQGREENFITMTGFPTFPNNEGIVSLLDADQNVIDKFSYLDDYHSSLLESVDGVSLERIDFNAATQSASNWTSASSTVGFATPGYLNSQSFEAPKISGSLEIVPRVFVPGSVSSATPSFTTINYQFDQAGKFANVTVYDQYGRSIQELANGVSLSTSGFIRWDGNDKSGKRVSSGYYLVVFEVFDGAGSKDILKETVVVGWE